MNNGIMKYRWQEMAHKQQNQQKKISKLLLRKKKPYNSREANARAHTMRSSPFIVLTLFISPIWLNATDRVRCCTFIVFCVVDRMVCSFCCLNFFFLLLLYWCACGAYLWLHWFVDREQTSRPIYIHYIKCMVNFY